jgi:hypothetical protein
MSSGSPTAMFHRSLRHDRPHGYDVCDYARLNPDLGAQEEFNEWTDGLKVIEGWGCYWILFPIIWELTPTTRGGGMFWRTAKVQGAPNGSKSIGTPKSNWQAGFSC